VVDRSWSWDADGSRSRLVDRSRWRVVVTQVGDIAIGAGQDGKGNNQEFLKANKPKPLEI